MWRVLTTGDVGFCSILPLVFLSWAGGLAMKDEVSVASGDFRKRARVRVLERDMYTFGCPRPLGKRVMEGETGAVVPLRTGAASAFVAPTPLPALAVLAFRHLENLKIWRDVGIVTQGWGGQGPGRREGGLLTHALRLTIEERRGESPGPKSLCTKNAPARFCNFADFVFSHDGHFGLEGVGGGGCSSYGCGPF